MTPHFSCHPRSCKWCHRTYNIQITNMKRIEYFDSNSCVWYAFVALLLPLSLLLIITCETEWTLEFMVAWVLSIQTLDKRRKWPLLCPPPKWNVNNSALPFNSTTINFIPLPLHVLTGGATDNFIDDFPHNPHIIPIYSHIYFFLTLFYSANIIGCARVRDQPIINDYTIHFSLRSATCGVCVCMCVFYLTYLHCLRARQCAHIAVKNGKFNKSVLG